jgi:hypothetical protein
VGQTGGQGGEEGIDRGAVDQHHLQRGTAGGVGQLAVERQRDGQLGVRAVVQVHVIDAATAEDQRDPRGAATEVQQTRAAAGDQHVDRVIAAQQLAQVRPILVFDDLHHRRG